MCQPHLIYYFIKNASKIKNNNPQQRDIKMCASVFTVRGDIFAYEKMFSKIKLNTFGFSAFNCAMTSD
jgi:hypothetical protein